MIKIEFNPQFTRALEAIKEGQNHLFVTGKAGTGKSTLLQYYRRAATETPVVLAPTGVAALEVGGETVHRFFGFGIDVTPEKVRRSSRTPANSEIFKRLRTLIIDEASMLRADLLDCVDMFLRKHGPHPGKVFGGVRLVLVGDLYQLPPVVTGDEREIFRTLYETPYFFSAMALQGADLEIIELDKVYRQRDHGFVDLLNRIRNDSVDGADVSRLNERLDTEFTPPDGEFYVNLTTTNKNADRINREKLASLGGKKWTSTAAISGKFSQEHFPTAIELAFKEGAQVMLLNNDPNGRWVNGSIGSVEAVHSSEQGVRAEVLLRDGAGLVEVEPYKWEIIRFTLDDGQMASEKVGSFTQLPFRLAWAVTIHKSQGKTFERVIIDLERGAFTSGQTYVALSRCTTFEGIVLKRLVKASSIRADWRVSKFLTSRRYVEAEAVMSVQDKTALVLEAIEKGADLQMTYLKPDNSESERLVTPISIGTESYRDKAFLGMRAYCHMRGAERKFRIDRMLAVGIKA